jgi:hypothetical protein
MCTNIKVKRLHHMLVCLTRLFNETSASPGMRVVRAGVLEGIEQFDSTNGPPTRMNRNDGKKVN